MPLDCFYIPLVVLKNPWESNVALNKALMEYEALDLVSALQESKLHHICAQIEHLLSGLHNMIHYLHLNVEDVYIQRIKEDLNCS